ncbi:MAG: hypothetical protein LBR32_10815 [Propionibacteriaceae bacterium]|nr:hypothetical protein [Propionibacteriaceae bacterium]
MGLQRAGVAGVRAAAAVLGLCLAFGFTACSTTDQTSGQSAAVAEQSTDDPSQDVHDDRPDDSADRPDDASSVGGDNSTARTTISAEARAWAQANGFDLAAFEDTVGSSVGEREFVASYFGVDSAAASLWRLGFLPSFDGAAYRLHSGKDGTVVYEIAKYDIDATPAANSPHWLPHAIGSAIAIAVVAGVVVALTVRKRRKSNRKPAADDVAKVADQ